MLCSLKPTEGSLRLNKKLTRAQVKFLALFSKRPPCEYDIKRDDLCFEVSGGDVSLREVCGLPLDRTGIFVLGDFVHAITKTQNPNLPKGVCGWLVDGKCREFMVFCNTPMVEDSDSFEWMKWIIEMLKTYWGILVNGSILFFGKHNCSRVHVNNSVVTQEPYFNICITVEGRDEYFDPEEFFDIEDFDTKNLELRKSPTYCPSVFL
jgi:hypothetical protein